METEKVTRCLKQKWKRQQGENFFAFLIIKNALNNFRVFLFGMTCMKYPIRYLHIIHLRGKLFAIVIIVPFKIIEHHLSQALYVSLLLFSVNWSSNEMCIYLIERWVMKCFFLTFMFHSNIEPELVILLNYISHQHLWCHCNP